MGTYFTEDTLFRRFLFKQPDFHGYIFRLFEFQAEKTWIFLPYKNWLDIHKAYIIAISEKIARHESNTVVQMHAKRNLFNPIMWLRRNGSSKNWRNKRNERNKKNGRNERNRRNRRIGRIGGIGIVGKNPLRATSIESNTVIIIVVQMHAKRNLFNPIMWLRRNGSLKIGEIKEMKETRKTEEMKETGETEELEESGESEYNPGKCSKCHLTNTGKNWCHPCNAKKFQNEFDKWTSGDREIDEFIQQIQLNANKYQEIIEWIPFDRLENVTYLAKGGFGTVYKAKWLDGYIEFTYKKNGIDLVNKLIGIEMVNEIKNQLKFRDKNSIAIYGITKNLTENGYMMVMNYAKYGSLRKLLNKRFEELTWRKRSYILSTIANGLIDIHEMGLMHKDFHPGNIVNQSRYLYH
ncbi:hypothetical protein Glove_23g100 [Diversispora epigaea]|uniref:Protein kinase domain-containing protein n=1 Tax=Diversispora epigaea TaxID=1348612 RepID=A0A397JLY3_9GLOM|nr:hypothetical protein Glove_23g100 [Diversispora epigaea]